MAEQGNKVANIVSRVETDYKERIVPELMKRFNYSSVMEVPHLEKIVINMGVGQAAQDSKFLEQAIADLTVIAGQKPIKTKSRNQLLTSNFVKDNTSVVKLHFVQSECMISSINSSQSLYHASATSAVSIRTLLMVVVISQSVSRNN